MQFIEVQVVVGIRGQRAIIGREAAGIGRVGCIRDRVAIGAWNDRAVGRPAKQAEYVECRHGSAGKLARRRVDIGLKLDIEVLRIKGGGLFHHAAIRGYLGDQAKVGHVADEDCLGPKIHQADDGVDLVLRRLRDFGLGRGGTLGGERGGSQQIEDVVRAAPHCVERASRGCADFLLEVRDLRLQIGQRRPAAGVEAGRTGDGAADGKIGAAGRTRRKGDVLAGVAAIEKFDGIGGRAGGEELRAGSADLAGRRGGEPEGRGEILDPNRPVAEYVSRSAVVSFLIIGRADRAQGAARALLRRWTMSGDTHRPHRTGYRRTNR